MKLRNVMALAKQEREGVQIPETLIDKLKPFGSRFIKIEPPRYGDRKSGKRAVEAGFQNHPYEADDKELQDWLAVGGNYAILAGKALILIDTDTKKANDKLKDIRTLKTQSGSGRGYGHIFMSDVTENGTIINPKQKNPKKRNIGNIQTANKYIVGPACRHYTGGLYKIIDDSPIAYISKAELEERFGDMLIWTGQKRGQLEEQAKFEEEQIGAAIPLKDVIDMSELTSIGHGEFQGAHPIHGSMTGQNFCVNLEKNCWHCFRCNSGGGGLMWIAVENGLLECHEAQKGALKGEKFIKAVKLAEEMGFDIKLFDEDLSPNVARFFEKEGRKTKFVPAYVAKELMTEFQYVTRKKDEMMFRYVPDKGIHEMFAEQHIKKQIRLKLGKHLNISRQREILNFIKVSTIKEVEESPPHLIVLQNGILNLKTGKLETFNPDYFVLNALDVAYKPEQDCPRFKKFISEVVRPEDALTLQEYTGFCLWREYIYHRCLLLVGEGANGKSTFLEALRCLLNPDNISSEPLQTLITNRFSLGRLYGKLANIYGDLPAVALKDTGYFKQLTGNETLSAEFKFRDRFDFQNYAKLVFSCNKIPATPDDTDAFFRRWIIIAFPNQFLEDDPKTDKRLLKKLTTKKELSGMLNWALEGLQRLLKNDKFSGNLTIEETRQQYTQGSNPVRSFAEQCLEIKKGNVIPKDDVYNAFIKYCEEHGLPTCAKNAFSMRLPEYIATSETRTRRLRRQVRAWADINFNEECDKSDKCDTVLSYVENEKDKVVNFSNRKTASLSSHSSQVDIDRAFGKKVWKKER